MKKGQLQLSFGMIFSIILIMATVAIAIYFIVHFVNTSKCAQIGLFKSDFQTAIDNVWRSAQAQKEFEINLPGNINEVCFGNLSSASGKYQSEFNELRRYQDFGYNLYLLPSANACDGNFATLTLSHIQNMPFTCTNLIGGLAKIKLVKESTSQNLVKIDTT